MTTLKSKSGKKGVNISRNQGSFIVAYVQYFNEGDQVRESLIEMKRYKSEKTATKWANNKLNINA